MANQMTVLFAKYKRLERRRDQAYDMVYAVTSSAREKLTEGAAKLDRQLLNVMREINRQADKLGVKTRQ